MGYSKWSKNGRKGGGKGMQPQSRLMHLTSSIVAKKQEKKPLEPIAPFRAGGGMRGRSEIGNRRLDPGLHESEYDSALLKDREELKERSSRFLFGPFVPNSSKPKWQTLAPLSYRRLPPTCFAEARPEQLVNHRRFIRTAPALQSTYGGLTGTRGDRNLVGLGDSRPTTAATSPGSPRSPRKDRAPQLEQGAGESDPSANVGEGSSADGNGSEPDSPREKPPPRNDRRKTVVAVKPSAWGGSTGEEKDEQRGFTRTSTLIYDQEKHRQAMGEIEQKEAVVIDTNEMKVFRRFQDENQVHVDDLPKCLIALGYAQPHLDWIPGLLRPISSYANLGMDKYLMFVEEYKIKQKKHLRADFDVIDEDGSGTLDKSELAGLLQSWGISPMIHVLQEVIDEVDDGTGNLDFEEFEKVVHLLRSRQGFCMTEYQEIQDIFCKFDRNKLGFMTTSDVRVALDWLGYAMAPERIDVIIQELDSDGSGQIDELEWLTGMRKVREEKVADLRKTILANDVNNDGNIQYAELIPILCGMGYFPDDQAVKETALAANIAEDDQDLDISELWRFMKIYRDREGLTSEEVQEIENGFIQCGVDPEGEVNTAEIGKIVRSIGYMVSFDLQQTLIAKVDIDASRALDQREFRKMVRLINQQDLDTIRFAFYEAVASKNLQLKQDGIAAPALSNSELLHRLVEVASGYRMTIPGDTDTITVCNAYRALKRLGCVDCNGHPTSLLASDKVGPDQVDIYGFCIAARRGRKMARAAFRRNGGFGTDEMRKMLARFREFDTDGSGELSGREIIKVLEAHFPTLANDAARRPLVQQLLVEADEDASGTLSFQDFLRLMRQVKDIQDQLMIRKELMAIEETRFSPTEVLEFRELLLAVRGESSEIGFAEVQLLLGAIVPMGAKNILQLKAKYAEVAQRQSGVEGSADKLDFPEFLWLMRELMDMNFASMTEKVQEMQDRSPRNAERTKRASVVSEA